MPLTLGVGHGDGPSRDAAPKTVYQSLQGIGDCGVYILPNNTVDVRSRY